MPTGVPIHDIRGHLFDAATDVLRREGPHALTSRAVTARAGVAKGILHRHFADFDTFLASLALARIEAVEARSKALRLSAGSETVVDHLTGTLTAALDADTLAIVNLVTSRGELRDRLRLTTPAGIPLLNEITRMIAAYLTAERGLGRIAIDADVDTIALILVGGAHLVLAAPDVTSPSDDEIRRLVTTAIAGIQPHADSAEVKSPRR